MSCLYLLLQTLYVHLGVFELTNAYEIMYGLRVAQLGSSHQITGGVKQIIARLQ